MASADKPNILVIWGDDIGITNLSCYSDGLMGYRTPNIDRIADEGMRFTDSYGEQSCTAGRASFITGQSVYRTGLSKVGVPGVGRRPAGRGPDDRRAAEAARLRHRAVRQEPPRRPEQVPADRARLRRVLRQPLPPERGGGAGAAELAARRGLPPLPRSLRPARRHPLVGHRRGRRHRGAGFGRVGKQRIEDTGPLTKKRMETIDDETVAACIDFIKRQQAADTPFFVWMNTTHMHLRTHTKPESVGQAGRWQSPYHDTMIDHDKHVGLLLDTLDELGHRREHDRHLQHRQRAAHEHLAGRRHDAVPEREEHELGRCVPRPRADPLAGQDRGGRRVERDRPAPRLAADLPRRRGRRRTSSRS